MDDLAVHDPQGEEWRSIPGRAGRTAYTPENTRITPSRPTARYCKACSRRS